MMIVQIHLKPSGRRSINGICKFGLSEVNARSLIKADVQDVLSEATC